MSKEWTFPHWQMKRQNMRSATIEETNPNTTLNNLDINSRYIIGKILLWETDLGNPISETRPWPNFVTSNPSPPPLEPYSIN